MTSPAEFEAALRQLENDPLEIASTVITLGRRGGLASP